MAKQNKKFWETVDKIRANDILEPLEGVRNSSPDVRNSSPDVRETAAGIRQSDVRNSSPDVRNSSPDVRETAAGIRQSDVRNSSPDVRNSSPDVRELSYIEQATEQTTEQATEQAPPTRRSGRHARAQVPADNSVRVRLTPDERRALDGLTDRLGLSVSDTIRRALRELADRT